LGELILTKVNGIDGEDVKRCLARLQRLRERKDQIAADIRTVYDDGESKGINRAALRRLFKKAEMTKEERENQDFQDAILGRAAGFEQLELTFNASTGHFVSPFTAEDAEKDIKQAQAESAAKPRRGRPPKAKADNVTALTPRGRGGQKVAQEAAEQAAGVRDPDEPTPISEADESEERAAAPAVVH
jgi:uncharacterized protein (UPF0335 family)